MKPPKKKAQATFPYCSICRIEPEPGTILYPFGNDGYICTKCKKAAKKPKPAPTLADHPATMMQRLGLIKRLNTLAQKIPDEHLTTFETWVAELEDEFQPAYTA